MKFKSWFILSEELYLQNNTATIFHRTPSFEYIQRMMNGGFTAGPRDFHGPGLYTTYTLEGTTNLGYGPFVVKLKVKNLKEYFILEPDVAKQIHGNNYKLKDQARILELTLKLTDEQWQKYQKKSETGRFGSAAASQSLKEDGHFLWEHGCKGIVYNGEQDGKCICVYAPYEGLQFLAYANAPTPTTVDFIEKNWVKSSKDASIRSISDLKFPKGTGIGSTSVKKQYQLSDPNRIIPSQILDDVRKSEYVKLKFYMRKNKLTGKNVFDLFDVASDKEKIAEILGADNINKLSSYNVSDLLRNASDKEKIARILGPDNINKLTGENVQILLRDAPDKDEMINFIIKYKTELSNDDVYSFLNRANDKVQMARILGQENIDKLHGHNVYYLLKDAFDKEKIVEILGQNNINKLDDLLIYNLLFYASDKDEMARILRQENINKLDGSYVYNLLNDASDKDEMVRILGQENINKLDDKHVYHLLFRASDKEEMVRILRQENINKLNSDDIYNLLKRADDKEKMAKMLRQNNIDKLTGRDVFELLIDIGSDKEKMAEILGPDNIDKLNGLYAYNLLHSGYDIKKMIKILGPSNINKLPKNAIRNLHDQSLLGKT